MTHWKGCKCTEMRDGYCVLCGAVDPDGPIRKNTMAVQVAIGLRQREEAERAAALVTARKMYLRHYYALHRRLMKKALLPATIGERSGDRALAGRSPTGSCKGAPDDR